MGVFYMASITIQRGSDGKPDGRRMIQFKHPDGKRRSLRLGKCSKKNAETVRGHVEEIIEHLSTGAALEKHTADWLKRVGDDLHDRMARAGLVQQREQATLDAFIADYIAKRTNVSESTSGKYEVVRRHLVDYFGANASIRDMSPGEAEEWRLHMLAKPHSENTVRKYTAIAKQFFRTALRKRMIEENPFDELPCNVQPNEEKTFIVPLDMAYEILAECPDEEWALIFALSRFGGVRCPSETMALEWNCIDWAQNRMTVYSPKTRRHAGKDKRTVPIFPELKPYLERAFEAAEEGSRYVISRRRGSGAWISSNIKRFIRAAGFEPWPMFANNLRKSRQTELSDLFPSHVVCAWMGNSRAVADAHYNKVTADHFGLAQTLLSGRQPSDAKAEEAPHISVLQPTATAFGDGCRKRVTGQEVRGDLEPSAKLQDEKSLQEDKGIADSPVVLA